MNKLRATLLSTTALLGLAGAARAAPPEPMPSWAGAYVGANLGIARLNASATETAGYGSGYGPCTGYYGQASCSTSATGLAIGPEAGFDWQTGNYVYGIVGDWTFTDLKHTVNANPSVSSFPTQSTAQLDWLASLRGRMGITLSDTLIYFTGGVAFGHLKDNTFAQASSGNGGTYGSLNTTKVGWVAGIGIEHKLNQQWSIKGEFLYYDLGTANSPSVTRVSTTYASQFSNEVLLGQLGLAYHF
jgi:outer membrane immunogenic protein